MTISSQWDPNQLFSLTEVALCSYVGDTWNKMHMFHFTTIVILSPETSARRLGGDATDRWPEFTIIACDCEDWKIPSYICIWGGYTVRLGMFTCRKWHCQRIKSCVSHRADQSGTSFSRHKNSPFFFYISQAIAAFWARFRVTLFKRATDTRPVLEESKWRDERTGSLNIIWGNVRYL